MEATQDAVRSRDGMAQKVGASAREAGERAQNALQEPMHQEPLQGAWEAMERIPVGAYYFAMVGSIATALGLYVSGKKESAQFVGQWAPTIALLGLMNRLLRPARGR